MRSARPYKKRRRITSSVPRGMSVLSVLPHYGPKSKVTQRQLNADKQRVIRDRYIAGKAARAPYKELYWRPDVQNSKGDAREFFTDFEQWNRHHERSINSAFRTGLSTVAGFGLGLVNPYLGTVAQTATENLFDTLVAVDKGQQINTYKIAKSFGKMGLKLGGQFVRSKIKEAMRASPQVTRETLNRLKKKPLVTDPYSDWVMVPDQFSKSNPIPPISAQSALAQTHFPDFSPSELQDYVPPTPKATGHRLQTMEDLDAVFGPSKQLKDDGIGVFDPDNDSYENVVQLVEPETTGLTGAEFALRLHKSQAGVPHGFTRIAARGQPEFEYEEKEYPLKSSKERLKEIFAQSPTTFQTKEARRSLKERLGYARNLVRKDSYRAGSMMEYRDDPFTNRLPTETESHSFLNLRSESRRLARQLNLDQEINLDLESTTATCSTTSTATQRLAQAVRFDIQNPPPTTYFTLSTENYLPKL